MRPHSQVWGSGHEHSFCEGHNSMHYTVSQRPEPAPGGGTVKGDGGQEGEQCWLV
jgi:hypothetical protein